MDIEKKRQHEQQILELMIRIYCKGNHKKQRRNIKRKQLCPECQKLADYALLRTQKCPFMATKTFCSACKVHCYTPQYQAEIKKVMKYAGPRMLIPHPVLTLKHGLITFKAIRAKKKGIGKNVS